MAVASDSALDNYRRPSLPGLIIKSLRRLRHLGQRGPTSLAIRLVVCRVFWRPLTGRKLRSNSDAAASEGSISSRHDLHSGMV
jgi:hypothetical protein